MIGEDKGQQDGPRGAFPELRQLGWRDRTMEQRVLQDRHGGVGWGLWGVLSCTRGRHRCQPVGEGMDGQRLGGLGVSAGIGSIEQGLHQHGLLIMDVALGSLPP